jgi:2-oxoglutarate ferredoxin oxidoreductase subunit beta
MTGGQWAPTTLVGQRATTAPLGREREHYGSPIRMSEMLATIDGAAYIERVTVTTPANIIKAKRAIKKAFQLQIEGKGFTMIEVLSTCPTNWGLTPVEALEWVKEKMVPVFPLGVFRDITAEEAK